MKIKKYFIIILAMSFTITPMNTYAGKSKKVKQQSSHTRHSEPATNKKASSIQQASPTKNQKSNCLRKNSSESDGELFEDEATPQKKLRLTTDAEDTQKAQNTSSLKESEKSSDKMIDEFQPSSTPEAPHVSEDMYNEHQPSSIPEAPHVSEDMYNEQQPSSIPEAPHANVDTCDEHQPSSTSEAPHASVDMCNEHQMSTTNTDEYPKKDIISIDSKAVQLDSDQSDKKASKDSLDNSKKILIDYNICTDFSFDDVEFPTAEEFNKRIQDTCSIVEKESAICIAPEGNALVVGDLPCDVLCVKKRILDIRLAFQMGEADSAIFLGNYAHNGHFCVEILNELLKFKLEFPQKVFLLCGPHENNLGTKALYLSDSKYKISACNEIAKTQNMIWDIMKKFPNEISYDIATQICMLFAKLPIAVEIPFPNETKAICLHGDILDETLDDEWESVMAKVKSTNIHSLSFAPKFQEIFCGSKVTSKTDQSIWEKNLGTFGYNYLVKGGHIESEISEDFNQKRYSLGTSIALTQPEKVCNFNSESILHQFLETVDKSDPDILYELGILELRHKNYDSAIIHLLFAKEKGCIKAAYQLGLFYEKGCKGSREYDKAKKLYEEISDQYAPAQFKLALYYDKGCAVEKDQTKALRLIESAANKGYVLAQYALGIILEEGKIIPRNYPEAIKLFEQAAQRGFAPAQFKLAGYYYGYSTTQNRQKALHLLTCAADRQYAPAQYKLGKFYCDGNGVPQDFEKALQLFRMSANNHYAQAQYELGLILKEGKLTLKNNVEAVKWFEQAATQGHSMASWELTEYYSCGAGREHPNHRRLTFEWSKKSAEQGNLDAKWFLGFCYLRGFGINKDCKKGLEILREGAEKEIPFAQYQLGLSYENGFGVKEDYIEATKFYSFAAAQGYNAAKEKLRKIKEKIESKKIPYEYIAKQRTMTNSESQELTPTTSDTTNFYLVYQRYVESTNCLGFHYALGLGIPSDIDKAVSLFKSAEKYHIENLHEEAITVLEEMMKEFGQQE